MSDLIKKDGDTLIAIIKARNNGLVLPNPFERDIYLFDTIIAGTSHIDDIERIQETLNIDDKVLFYREPENKFDPQVIRVENQKEEKIGYIPQQDNIVFSRLMDAGKILFGKIKSKEKCGNWYKIDIRIYMHEN